MENCIKSKNGYGQKRRQSQQPCHSLCPVGVHVSIVRDPLPLGDASQKYQLFNAMRHTISNIKCLQRGEGWDCARVIRRSKEYTALSPDWL